MVRGITTDALPLYPRPIASVFGAIPHPICEFHIPKGLTTAVLRVLARSRKRLAVQAPKLPRGRPKGTAGAQRLHRRAEAIPQRVGGLFEHRHLFARHRLTAAQRAALHRSVRRSGSGGTRGGASTSSCAANAAGGPPIWRG